MRITGGTHRSRALRAPNGHVTRPTSDRVREALFGILSSAGLIEGAHVLDIYAGTGALALEALSRGAARATLVEYSRPAVDAIRANIASLGVAHCTNVIAADVRRAARRITRQGPFDLILVDPPWSLVDCGDAREVVGDLCRAGAFAPGGRVVLEHASRTPSPYFDAIIRLETREYGDTALTFYKTGILAPPRQEVAAGSPSD